MSRRNSTEIVHEGWLTKSPPIKRIWRARWRKRWFVLRQTGELPGQYFLEYYTDRQCLKLKGRVDLDQCEQVDAGLQFENSKLKYLKHLFDLKTPKRTYYLAADTEADMNKWVDCVCQVCGLKADNHEETYYDYGPPLEEANTESTNSGSFTLAPVEEPDSPNSTQYILMSECYSGRPPPNIEVTLRRSEKPVKLQHLQSVVQDEFYDAPRRLQPPAALDLVSSTHRSATPPLQSPGTDSVFIEEDWPAKEPASGPGVNWSTFPRDSSTSDQEPVESTTPSALGTWSVARRFSKVCLQDADIMEPPPPRPPKPSHLAEVAGHGYLNLSLQPGDPGVDHLTADDMYDFPRSHQTAQPNVNCYTNAAPSSAGLGQGVVFRYDFASTTGLDNAGEVEPSTPKSENGSLGSTHLIYSNLPSPAAPPCVNRELKPGRRLSDSMSNEPSPLAPCSPASAPSVDRKLKPRKVPDSPKPDPSAIPLAPAPTLRDIAGVRRKPRAAPSPTPPGCAPPSPAGISLQHYESGGGYWSCSDDETRFRDSADEEANFYYVKDIANGRKRFDKLRLDKVKYLDLDHDTMMASTKTPKAKPTQMQERSTIYNTVDFVKTKAFNRTRKEVELERQSPSTTTTAVQS